MSTIDPAFDDRVFILIDGQNHLELTRAQAFALETSEYIQFAWGYDGQQYTLVHNIEWADVVFALEHF